MKWPGPFIWESCNTLMKKVYSMIISVDFQQVDFIGA